jgi:hypothetical protein
VIRIEYWRTSDIIFYLIKKSAKFAVFHTVFLFFSNVLLSGGKVTGQRLRRAIKIPIRVTEPSIAEPRNRTHIRDWFLLSP